MGDIDEERAGAYFADAVNPTEAEIEAWAYAGEFEPMQDFELIVFLFCAPALLARLATDPAVPHRSYFLRCLYHRFGEIYRFLEKRTAEERRTEALEVLDAVPPSDDPLLLAWRTDCRRLMDGITAWSGEDWCDGDLARRRFKALTAPAGGARRRARRSLRSAGFRRAR
jgi:hypothetical protein